jgi:RNA polymerase sigma-70 factor (ECF subfamily)
LADPAAQSELVAKAVRGDHLAFAALIEPHRADVFRHCYRMLGSGLDAEDATQDTLERAWRRLATFAGAGPFGGWLHRVATNVCLDLLRSKRARRDPTGEGISSPLAAFRGAVDEDTRWVEPVSDIDLVSAGDPQSEVLRREDISLAFVAALQRLAPRQRAALLLCDVIGFSQAEVAEVLDMTPSAVNSLLSRAREAARSRPTGLRVDRNDPRVRDLLDRYIRAWQMADIGAFVQLIADDVRFTMPPMHEWFEGHEAVAFVDQVVFAPARPAGIALRLGWCNTQPAFATYQPENGRLVASGLQVLELADAEGRTVVRTIVSYRDPGLVARCGLPSTIP